MINTLNEWSVLNNDDDEWAAFYGAETLMTKAWHDFFWHSNGTVNRRNLEEVQLGMTRKEVRDIMGGPGRVIRAIPHKPRPILYTSAQSMFSNLTRFNICDRAKCFKHFHASRLKKY